MTGKKSEKNPVLKSKEMMYQEPSKNISDAQETSKKRIKDKQAEKDRKNIGTPLLVKIDREKQETLIGQLKAAEARNRQRIMRLRYQTNREREIRHLVSCQPTALEAVRLQALLPDHLFHKNQDDTLSKVERERVEKLLE